MALTGSCARDQVANPSLSSEERLAVALERSAGAFSRKVLAGDQSWMAKQGGGLLGGEFEPWADALFVETRVIGRTPRLLVALGDRRDPLPPPLPTPAIEAVSDPVHRLSSDEMEHIKDTMILAIQCAHAADKQRKRLLARVEEPGRSYVVTHQLWALVTGHHLGCIDDATFDRLRPPLATAVYAELLADTEFNDLMAERMAMLAYAGLVAWLPAETVELALDTQHPSGVWLRHQVDVGPFATSNIMHMSTLAFYALASVWVAERERS